MPNKLQIKPKTFTTSSNGTAQTQPYERVAQSRGQVFMNNLIGGIAWTLGATIGLSLVVILLGFIANQVNFVPIVGDFVADVSKFVEQKNSR